MLCSKIEVWRSCEKSLCSNDEVSRGCEKSLCSNDEVSRGCNGINNNDDDNNNHATKSRHGAILIFRGVVVGVAKANHRAVDRRL